MFETRPDLPIVTITATSPTSSWAAPGKKPRHGLLPGRRGLRLRFEAGVGVAFTEQVIIEYYATDGVFEYEIKIASSPETGWAARKAASGKDLTLWMVVHDDRGGATWAERQVHVQ